MRYVFMFLVVVFIAFVISQLFGIELVSVWLKG